MDKFEYEVCSFERISLEKSLNRYGAQGWELITCIKVTDEFPSIYKCIFKRKIKGENNE